LFSGCGASGSIEPEKWADVPVTALGWPDAVVTDQSPESGAKVPVGTTVTLWIERGGGSGVREPRRPLPRPRTGQAMKDDPLDDAVGS